MPTHYTKEGCLPRPLPEILQLSNGDVRSGSSTFTAEEIADAGWTVAPAIPTFNPVIQVANWSTENSNYVIENIPQEILDERTEAMWRGIRHERSEILSQSDYMVIKAYETGTTLDSEWAAYRQALRDLPSTSDDPSSIVWPTKPS